MQPQPIPLTTCHKCGRLVNVNDLGREGDHRRPECKPCLAAKAKTFRGKQRAKIGPTIYQRRRAERTALLESGLRKCRTCTETLPLDRFGYSAQEPDKRATKCRDCAASYHRINRERALARYWADPENSRLKTREARHRWQERDPEAYAFSEKEKSARRRALAKQAGVERVDLAAIIERDGMLCHICKKRIILAELTFDHLIPIIHGGPTANWNLAPAHLRCNSQRGAGRTPAQPRLAF